MGKHKKKRIYKKPFEPGIKKHLENRRFNLLTVIKETDERRSGQTVWLCQCDCGSLHKIATRELTSGQKSCGCAKAKRGKQNHFYKHGMVSLYRVWYRMRSRCYNQKNNQYKNYGARGIGVDSRWSSFESFLEDNKTSYLEHIKEHGKRNTSLERVNNDLGYSPSNCRWATKKEQVRNRRVTLTVPWQDNIPMAELAEKLNIKYSTLYYRFRHGWPKERIINN